MLNVKVPKFKSLLTDQLLYDAGISLVIPHSMSDHFLFFYLSLFFFCIDHLTSVQILMCSIEMGKIRLDMLQNAIKRKEEEISQEAKKKKAEEPITLSKASTSTPTTRSSQSPISIKEITFGLETHWIRSPDLIDLSQSIMG